MVENDMDELFGFLYQKGPRYTTYGEIFSECFPKNDMADVEGMTIKMHRDGFLDCGAIESHQVIKEYVQKGIYKLSINGKEYLEKIPTAYIGKPYTYKFKREREAEDKKFNKLTVDLRVSKFTYYSYWFTFLFSLAAVILSWISLSRT